MCPEWLANSLDSDCEPFRPSTVRRCTRVRDRLGHHVDWRVISILWREDWTITLGQAYREGGGLRKQCMVGTGEQAHDTRRAYTLVSITLLELLCNARSRYRICMCRCAAKPSTRICFGGASCERHAVLFQDRSPAISGDTGFKEEQHLSHCHGTGTDM